jgi:hypothetical protein
MLRFLKRRTPWLAAGCLFFNTLVKIPTSRPPILATLRDAG